MIAAFDMLGTNFAEMGFLITDVAGAAAKIQKSLDEQSANVRAIIDQNDRQSTEIRLAREDLAAIERRTRASAVAGSAEGDPGPLWVHGCPYKGLLPFGEADAEVFYGRERLTADLAVKLAAQMTRGGLVIVTGASGAGKSSLLRAGLLPTLARGMQVEGSQHWPRSVMTPTKDPLTELATRLAALGGSDTVAVRDNLARHPGQAHLAVRSAVLAHAECRDDARSASGEGDARLVLVVDQFEQIFTLSPGAGGEAERQAFITALRAAATEPAEPNHQPPALVVIAVRGDFWDRCAAYPELACELQEGQFVVGPMIESDLRRAITGPADAAGLHTDAALTDAILSDLRAAGGEDAVGALPLLSQAMLLTWDNREGSRLTLRGYGLAGGVSHAVQASADAAYDALQAQQQVLTRELLRTMTVAGRDGRLTRRPVTRVDLYAVRPDADRSRVDAVLEAFAAKRLIVLNEGTAQMAHDALLAAWPRLRGWLEEDQATWILHGQLTDDAAAWHDSGDDQSFLYRGTQLAALQRAVTGWSASPDRYPALTGTQNDFLRASERAVVRSSRQRRMVAGVLIILLIAALTGAGIAATAAKNANQQRRFAVSGQLAVESEALDSTDPVTASLLAAAAWHFDPTAQAKDSMLDVLAQPERAVLAVGTGPNGVIGALAFSPDGKTLATAGRFGALRLWDIATRRQIGPPLNVGAGRYGNDVALSPGGRIMAVADSRGTVRLWDVATRRQIGAFTTARSSGVPAFPGVLAFSPGGQILAAAAAGTVRFWDVALRRPISSVTTSGYVSAVAFSPDGKLLATADPNNGAQLWDVATGHRARPSLTTRREIYGLVFSPDGRILVAASPLGAVLWNVVTGQRLGAALAAPGGMYQLAAFSPDGKTLATADQGGTTRLWDVASHQLRGAPLTPGASPVTAVAFSPDGKSLATADADGMVQVWDAATWRPIGAPINPGGRMSLPAVAFSPDGATLATASGASAQLWDVTSRQQLGALWPDSSNNLVAAVAFSPDRKTLATATTNAVLLWGVATHRLIGALSGVNVTWSAVAFSPDGKTLATANGDAAQLWNVATKRVIRPTLTAGTGINSEVREVAFSTDGKTLATVTADAVLLWRVTTHRLISALRIGPPVAAGASYREVSAIGLSPGGNILSAATGDTVRLWDLATRQQIAPPLSVGASSRFVNALAFSPDGKILATAGSDGMVRLWDLATRQQIGPSLDVGAVVEMTFSPDGKTLATSINPVTSGNYTVQLWDVALPNSIAKAVCSVAGRSLTQLEWKTYISSEPFQQVCP